MKIGILQADSVLDEFRDEFGDYAEMFEELLQNASDKKLSFVTYYAHALELPEKLDECDGYLITGSRYSVYDEEPWIEALNVFVRSIVAARKKLVGICFGHQLIAHLFGGKTGLADAGWGVGVHTSKVTADNEHDTISLLSMHKDQVVELPRDAQVIATSKFCPIAGFSIGEAVLTFQGHPEYSKNYARKLMDVRQEMIGDVAYNNGIESLQEQTDEQVVAKWIIEFFSRD